METAKQWPSEYAGKEAERALEKMQTLNQRLETVPVVTLQQTSADYALRGKLIEELQELKSGIELNAAANEHYRQTINELSPSLLQELVDDRENARIELEREATAQATPENTRSELLSAEAVERRAAEEGERQISEAETQEAIDYRLARRMEREQREYMDGLMDMNKPTGKELSKGDYIVPRSVAQAYVEVDGKFYTKDVKSPRCMFEDKGDKLSTSTTDPKAIADMVALAKAKQWDSLKLSGSQEFRREAWLQAESQGIKATGYTPKQADLAALETLRQERATNNIQPMRERQEERATQQAAETKIAPRHDLNKNQAQLDVTARARTAENVEALKKNPAFADRPAEALEKLAYWRGLLAERFKDAPESGREAALAEYDKKAENPAFLAALEKSDTPAQEVKTESQEQRQERKDTHEQSL